MTWTAIDTKSAADKKLTLANWNDQVKGNLEDIAGASGIRWVDWTPTLSQSAGITITVTRARYVIVGKIAVVQITLALTSAGTAGQRIYLAGIPAAIAPLSTGGISNPIGTFGYFDAAPGAFYSGTAIVMNATTLAFSAGGSNNDHLGVAPALTIANGDTIGVQGCYEIA